MIGNLGRRAVEAVVGLFAVLGFAFVPLGSKTGLEHALALAATPSAREAVSGLATTVGRARDLVFRSLTGPERAGVPLPLPSSAAGGGVRPLVPELPPNAGQRR